jgi:hypothetical protein
MYRVTRKFGRGPESQIGLFKTIPEAKKLIEEKLAEDAKLNLKAIYGLYEGMDLMEEFDQSHVVEKSAGSESSASQKSSGQRFTPSPFNTAPAPKGIPRSSWSSDDSDKNSDKK